MVWNRYYRGTPLTTLLLGLGGVILFRSMVRANKVPGFERQDETAFKLRPVLKELAKGAGFVLAGFVCIAISALGVRFRVIPDSYTTVLLFLVPSLGLIGWGFILLLRATARAMWGGSS